MDGDSRIKVMKAGFTIIRADDQPTPRIKHLIDSCGNWKTIEGDFKSKAARDRRFKELMKEDKVIND